MNISLALNHFSTRSTNANLNNIFDIIKPEQIYLCGIRDSKGIETEGSCQIEFEEGSFFSGATLKRLINSCSSDLLAVVLKPGEIELNEQFLSEVQSVFAEQQEAIIAYACHEICDEQVRVQPLADYQEGSVREDFDFGPLVVLNIKELKKEHSGLLDKLPLDDTGWYGFRLQTSRATLPVRISTNIYKLLPLEETDSEKEHFSYVDPRNAEYQKRLEDTFKVFSKRAGFFLKPESLIPVEFSDENFSVEASVIIPVKNRERTIGAAVESALSQECSFEFNVIVVDNHSSDDTTGILSKIAKENPRLIHIVPDAEDLQIGGCWNLALNSSSCGKFAVQLDSDDIYQDESTLQKVVDCFYATKAAAVVGSYTIVDRDLNVLPPGLIDHREWTESNGHNNALRINGLGAPRAYFTPVIREIGFPNLSYGEDYAAMLGVCRKYRIGRIYDSLYLCRRWEGNTDSGLTIEKQNAFNTLKDGMRTEEIVRRKELAR